MKELNKYILEELDKPKPWIEVFNTIFQSAEGISKDTITSMLKPLYPDRLRKLCKYWDDTDSQKFITYQPNDDEMLKEENKDKICKQLAEYIFNNIVKRS
jgi:hypothetical protein